MLVFMALSVLYLGGWGIMFISTTFRWTFITWTFFSIMATASVFLTVLSIVLGVVCGLNFGKGLARYREFLEGLYNNRCPNCMLVNAQHPIDEEDTDSLYPGDKIEKVDFPSSEKPLPTYASVDFKQSYQGLTLGPRFANKDAAPFETMRSVTYPTPTLSRNRTDLQLQRTDSYGSTKSGRSSHSSHSSGDTTRAGQKRWVIE